MRRSITSVAVTGLLALVTLAACGSDAKRAASTTDAPAVTIAGTTASTTADSTSETTPISVITTAATAPSTTDSGTDPSTDPTDSTDDPATTEPATTEPATTPATEAPTTVASTTTVPDALQQLPGVAAMDITLGGTDPTRPTFTWAAPAGATTYQLVVQTQDGTPVWGWSGTDTTIPLGGAERAAEVEGPAIEVPSRVRVYALDASNGLVGISGWVPLAAFTG